MWKTYASISGVIFLLVLIIAFENLSFGEVNFLFLFTYTNKSLFSIIMWMFFFGVLSGLCLGLIPGSFDKKDDDGSGGGSDLDF